MLNRDTLRQEHVEEKHTVVVLCCDRGQEALMVCVCVCVCMYVRINIFQWHDNVTKNQQSTTTTAATNAASSCKKGFWDSFF